MMRHSQHTRLVARLATMHCIRQSRPYLDRESLVDLATAFAESGMIKVSLALREISDSDTDAQVAAALAAVRTWRSRHLAGAKAA